MSRKAKAAPPLHRLIKGLAESELATPGDTRAQQHEALLVALDGAVTLEFATIPTYLTALWTIKDELHPLAKSLRNILQEEMLHLALVCNMMVSIGGTPKIKSAVPSYPGKLPLGVHPELIVPLGRFGPDTLGVFIEIERPEFEEPDHPEDCGEHGIEDHADMTIGQLYFKIRQAFHELDPEFSQDRQVTGPLSWRPILSLKDVDEAIEIIERQGEGSIGKPEERHDHLAHYWRFREMLELRRLVNEKKDKTNKDKKDKWVFRDPIDFDFTKDVIPIADVPQGGYPPERVADENVRHLLRQFNLTYSKMLDELQAAWSGVPGQAHILRAVELMFALEKYAKPLMAIPAPGGQGNYAPDFRYIPLEER